MKFFLFTLLILVAVSVQAQDTIVLMGAQLIDGTGAPPVLNSVIVIEGSTITRVGTKEFIPENGKLVMKIRTAKGMVEIPENAGVYDVSGKVIIPGLIDAHIHYDGVRRDLLQMLAWGVTSANCMVEATSRALMLEKETAPDSVASPQLYATAPIFSTKNGWWWGKDFPDDPALNRFPSTPADARKQVRRAKAKGIKRIKLMYDDMRWCRDTLPPLIRMKKNVMAALLDEAGKQGVIAEIHAPQLQDAREVLAAGFTPRKQTRKDTLEQAEQIGSFGFAHGILDDIVSEDVEQTMRSKHAFYIPTFSVFEFLANPRGFMQHVMQGFAVIQSLPESTITQYMSIAYDERYRQRYPNGGYVNAHLPVLRQNMKSLYDHHVPVVMGSDMWALPGLGAHLELEYMVQAGLSPMEAIVAATKMGARFLGRESTLGTIEVGKQADLLILDANPLEYITSTKYISKIIKHGMIYDRRDLIERAKKE